jgi:hypothetical protein
VDLHAEERDGHLSVELDVKRPAAPPASPYREPNRWLYLAVKTGLVSLPGAILSLATSKPILGLAAIAVPVIHGIVDLSSAPRSWKQDQFDKACNWKQNQLGRFKRWKEERR